MTTDLVTIRPTATVSEAARLLAEHHVRRLLVVDGAPEQPHLVGVMSSHDVWRACPPDRNPLTTLEWPADADRPVAALMTRQVVTTTPDTPIDTAAAILRAERIGALPVLRGGHLVGIVTESDVLDALLETLGTVEHGTRVTFDAGAGESVVADMATLAAQHRIRLLSVLSLRHHDRATGDDRAVGVVRLAGEAPRALIDAIWASGHPVRSVVATGGVNRGSRPLRVRAPAGP